MSEQINVINSHEPNFNFQPQHLLKCLLLYLLQAYKSFEFSNNSGFEKLNNKPGEFKISSDQTSGTKTENSPQDNPEVSIIILNYNQSKLTLECVASILRVEKKLRFELIIVDNGSNEDQAEILDQSELKKHYILIKSTINGGFGYGNNLGAQQAKGNHMAFINNDTYFKKKCFYFLKNYILSHPEVGVSGPLQLAPNNIPRPSFDHHLGIRKFIFGSFILEAIFRKPKRKAQLADPSIVDFVQGCFMFFRRSAFEEVGGFDPNIFLYDEEMDICTRLQKKGYKVVYHPGIDYYHIHEASTSISLKTTGSKKVQILYSYLYVLKNIMPT